MTDLAVVVCLSFDHRASPEGLSRFKECIRNCSFVETTLEVSGSFDLIAQGSCASLAEYTQHMELIRDSLAKFVTRIETNFVTRKTERSLDGGDTGALWLPCQGGHKRVEAGLIDKIVAEGDYMRVHVGDWNCLIHSTMQHMCEQLQRRNFIKLHRSLCVSIKFIDRLVHVEQRWQARLRDGTHVNIAKGHVREVLDTIAGESSKLKGRPSNRMKVAGSFSHFSEKRVQSKLS
jgi:hypothetical protein